MFKIFKSLFWITTFFLCNNTKAQDNVKERLQGLWSSGQISRSNNCPEGPYSGEPFKIYPGSGYQYYVKGDTIWRFAYPCEYYNKFNYLIKGDLIFNANNKELWKRLEFIDNVGLYISDLNKDSCMAETEYFKRDTFSLLAVETLIKNRINPACLTGRLKLLSIRQLNGEPFNTKSPIALPKFIEIVTIEQANKLFTNRSLLMLVSGKKRLFNLEYIDWEDTVENTSLKNEKSLRKKAVLVLHPDKWWKGKAFEVRYQLQ